MRLRRLLRRRVWLASFAGAAVVAAIAGCSTDPVHDAEVAALGPEVPGMPKSLYEYHRAGQPCLVCHGGEGPAHTQFSFGGTVFAGPFSCTSTNNTTGLTWFTSACSTAWAARTG